MDGRPAPDGGPAFVSFARFADLAEYERYTAALERDEYWREVVRPGLRTYVSAQPVVWRLVPVARSLALERPWERSGELVSEWPDSPPICAIKKGGDSTSRLVTCPADTHLMRTTGLRGAELVEAGLEDLLHRRETVESLVVSMGAERLRALGIHVPEPIAHAELRLCRLLAAKFGHEAHARYNALLRRLVIFHRAACERLGDVGR